MPIPQDLHRHVMITRFQRRRFVAAGLLVLAAVAAAYACLVALYPPPVSPGGLPAADRIGLGVLAMFFILLLVYVYYRCPNCHIRSWGSSWLGLNPTRCPSCKSSLK